MSKSRGLHAAPGRKKLFAVLGVAAVLATSITVLAANGSASADPTDGTITVIVDRDVLGSGVYTAAVDNNPVPGIVLKISDAAGHVVSGTTNAAGQYVLAPTAALTGGSYRIDATIPAGLGALRPAPAAVAGTPNAFSSMTSFVTVAGGSAKTVRMAVWNPRDFVQTNPPIVVPENRAATIAGVGTLPALRMQNYTATGDISSTTTGAKVLATQAQIGTVWGTAPVGDQYALSAALFKRHAQIGPNGIGEIYLTDALAGAPNGTPWLNFAAAGISVGTDPRGAGETSPTYDWFHDPGAAATGLGATSSFAAVGRIGLGTIQMSADQQTLYVTNLFDRRIYAVPVTYTAAGAPVAGSPVAVTPALTTAGAAKACAQNPVPFGLGERDGDVYFGLTCPGPAQADLRAYIYTLDEATNTISSAPVLEFPLTYARNTIYTSIPATYEPWTDTTFPNVAPYIDNVGSTTQSDIGYPQAQIGAITFDRYGNISLGIKDRFADQTGYNTGAPTGGTKEYEGMSAGELLRACGNAYTGWTLESNGSCGGVTGAKIGNGGGPGGGQFFLSAYSTVHANIFLGGALQLASANGTLATGYDTVQTGDPGSGVNRNGLRTLTNVNGAYSSGSILQEGNSGTFGKSSGLGSLSALVDEAPLQIGNRVWIDTNHNGIQDPDESAVPGVTVRLYAANGTTVLAGAVTDANGEYYFGANPTPTFSSPDITLDQKTTYVVSLPASNFGTGAVLGGYTATIAAAGSDRSIDSNGAMSAGSDRATVTTSGLGVNDPTIDFGVVAAYAVGDKVFYDNNRNGVQDSGEPPVVGATATLLAVATDGSTSPATHLDGTAVTAVPTDAAGHYDFTQLAAGRYRVQFSTLPPGYTYTQQNGTPSAAADSNPNLSGLTPVFTLGPIGAALPDMRAPVAGDAAGNVVAIDPTIDAGIVLEDAVSVGDFVWIDTNRDGVQQAGEPGISGVRTTITGPGGAAVTDIYGNPVGPITTNGSGKYLFDNLPTLPAGQHYTVTVDPTSAALAGFNPTTPGAGADTTLDSSTGSATSTADLSTNGAADLSLDFGFVADAVSVGDFVWADTDGNGVQGTGELGIAGVHLELTGPTGAAVTDVNGNAVGEQITDTAGKYLFPLLPTLPAGQHYTVTIDGAASSAALAGFVPTITSAGTTATDSSNGSATSAAALTANGASDLTLDFGFVKPVSVGDFVWLDANHNGVQDGGEVGIGGVTVTITKADGSPVTDLNGNSVTSTVTDSGGKYEFPDLPPGQYVTHIDNTQPALAAVIPTVTGAGAEGTDSSTGAATSVVLTSGGSDQTLDFGFFPRAVSVGDFVWVDANGDGVQTAGEPGIPGVHLTLTGPTGSAVTDVNGLAVGEQITDGAGNYRFGNLPALPTGQHYTVTINQVASAVALAGYVPTRTGAGTAATDSSSGAATSVADLSTDGASDLTLDFGFVKPVSIGNFLWVDTNGNGVQDAGEPGLAGVTVTITHADGTPVTDVGGQAVVSTVTGDNGSYDFTDLPPGQYIVSVDPTQPALAGYVSTQTGQGTTATDSSTGSATSVVLPSGSADDTLDFGFVKPVSVGDFVWVDSKGDGVQSAGEPGIPGVTVTITKADGSPVTDVNGLPITSTTTGLDGKYEFTDLPPGQYVTHIDNAQDALAGYVPTVTGRGDTSTDSSDGSSTSAVLPSGATDRTLDFGFVKPVSVGDLIWLDGNHNGVQEPTDAGIAGVTVTITKLDGSSVTDVNGHSVTSAISGPDGKYEFADLPPGQYVTHVDNNQAALAGVLPTVTGAGTASTDSADGSATSAVLPSGSSDQTLDFGFYRPSVSVGDFVWVDTNGNGVQDSGEPGIPGVHLQLTGPDGKPVTDVDGDPVGEQITGTDGKYLFPGLPVLPPDEHYTATIVPAASAGALAGLTPTRTGAGTGSTDSSVGSSTSTADLSANGDSDLTLDFGFIAPVSVGDFVWVDTNGNGVQNAGEPGIPGVTVTITRVDGSPVTDVTGKPVTSTVTDADGKYTFTDLPPGQYVTHIDNGQGALSGYAPTLSGRGAGTTDSSNGSSTSAVLPSGSADLGLDFGFVKPVSVGDFVWIDGNHNGVQDKGEPGIAGVTVTITRVDGSPVTDVTGKSVTPTVTDANGKYTFGDLPPGQYVTHIDNTQTTLAGYLPTVAGRGTAATGSSDGSSTSAVLPSGASDPTLDFGFFAPVSVGDLVWVDSNGNGVQDEGEPGIKGVVVTITTISGGPVVDVHGDPVTSVRTDSAGHYLFTDLPPGQYVTHVDNSQPVLQKYIPTGSGQGSDAAKDSSKGSATSVLLPSGSSDLTLDFGFFAPVSVGNLVWVDTNDNGVQDAGEPGIPGVVVTITHPDGSPVVDVDGQPVGPVTTDRNGHYQFPNLPPGQYVTHIDPNQPVLAPYVPTKSGAGDRTNDSSDGSAESSTLTSGGTDQSLDFGFVPKVTVLPLAYTGAPVRSELTWAALALLVGSALLLVGRRRSASAR